MSLNKTLRDFLLGCVVLAVVLALFTIKGKLHDRKFALFNAALDGNLEQVKFLIQQGAPINQKVDFPAGWTPLITAIFHNYTNVANYLIKAGADVNLASKNGRTPLIWAATSGDGSGSLVKELIAHGANVAAKDEDGFTAVQYARGEPPQPITIQMLEAAELAQTSELHKANRRH